MISSSCPCAKAIEAARGDRARSAGAATGMRLRMVLIPQVEVVAQTHSIAEIIARHGLSRVALAPRLERPEGRAQTRAMTLPPRVRAALAGAVLAVGLLACSSSTAPNPYRTLTDWMMAPTGRVLGSMSMVDVAPDGTLWIAERCGANDCLANGDVDPILHVGADGAWLGAFGAGVFAWPHGIYVDAAGDVWVTDARGGDDRGHQVIKFAADGRALL